MTTDTTDTDTRASEAFARSDDRGGIDRMDRGRWIMKDAETGDRIERITLAPPPAENGLLEEFFDRDVPVARQHLDQPSTKRAPVLQRSRTTVVEVVTFLSDEMDERESSRRRVAEARHRRVLRELETSLRLTEKLRQEEAEARIEAREAAMAEKERWCVNCRDTHERRPNAEHGLCGTCFRYQRKKGGQKRPLSLINGDRRRQGKRPLDPV